MHVARYSCCLAHLQRFASVLCAPPIGGLLYQHFGFRGPFIFDIIIAFIDLVGRMLVIEKKDALKWELVPTTGIPDTPQRPQPAHDDGENLIEDCSINLRGKQKFLSQTRKANTKCQPPHLQFRLRMRVSTLSMKFKNRPAFHP